MGGFQVPPMPAQLIEALKRQQGGPLPPGMPPGTAPLNGRPGMTMPQGQMPGPLPMVQPTPSGALPPPPSSATSTLGPMAPKEATVPTKTGAPVPAPTDDPAVVGMGAMPKTPDLGSYLNPALKQYQSDLSGYQQADVANRINPQQVKPKLWERLLGGVLGATQLKNPENAGNVAGQVVHRDLNRAELQRKTAMAPWTERLQMDKEGLPLAEANAKTGYEQGELDLKTAAEQRDRFTAIKNADYKDAIAQVREEAAQGNIDKAEKLLDEKQKEFEVTSGEKKQHDAEWFQLQHAFLDIRQQLADARDRQVDKGGKAKPSQSVGIESKKAAALAKAKTTYDKETELAGSDSEARATAETNFKQAQQDAQDAYEAEINAAGGEAQHQDVESWRGKPAVKPATPGTTPATAPAANDEGAPTVMGPKGETPTQTANNGKTKIGFYKSTGQWMLVPNSTGGR